MQPARVRTKFTMTPNDAARAAYNRKHRSWTERRDSRIVVNEIVLGDPVPWFAAPLIGDGAFNLSVAAGRWIVLSFLGSPANPRVAA